MIKVTKKQAVTIVIDSIVIELWYNEAEALAKLIGGMSHNDYVNFGLSDEQSEIIYQLYDQLAKVVGD